MVVGDLPDNSPNDNYIPSYVGLSCAVSGYRHINKYDATSRIGSRSRNSHLIDLQSQDDNCDFHRVSDLNKNELLLLRNPHLSDTRIRSLSSDRASDYKKVLNRNMEANLNQNRFSVHCSNHYQMEAFSSTINSTALPPDRLCRRDHAGEVASSKSFIQQKIDRLYQSTHRNETGFDQSDAGGGFSINNNNSENSDGFPSVFKHLRPEFRHLLPIRPKRYTLKNIQNVQQNGVGGIEKNGHLHRLPQHHDQWNSVIVKNGSSIDTQDVPDNKSWQTLKNDINSIPKISTDDTHYVESESTKLDLNKNVNKPAPASHNITNASNVSVTSSSSVKPSSDSSKSLHCSSISESSPEQASKPSSSRAPSDKASSDLARPTPNSNVTLSSVVSESGTHLTRPETPPDKTKKDGHYFLKVVEEVVGEMERAVVAVEEDLTTFGDRLSDDVKGKLMATSGKAHLLINKKIKQFKGLCQKNITKCVDEEFPTTDEDLAGFWDMVLIQIDDVNQMLGQVDQLRKNDWREIEASKSTSGPSREKRAACQQPRKTTRPTKASVSASSKPECSDKQKASEERRRQMREALAAKRKAALAAQKSKNTSSPGHDDVIFM